MLSNLTKFILFNIILILSFISIIGFYGKFIVINESFYTYTLKRDNTYRNLTKSIKFTAQEQILNQFTKTPEYQNLTATEKQEVNNQIKNLISFIDENNVSDFLTKNISNISGYLHNHPGDLYLYIPIKNWGFAKEALDRIPDFLKRDNITVNELLKTQSMDTANNLKILSSLKYTSYFLLITILISCAIEILLIFLYSLISRKGERIQAIGKLLTFSGIITLLVSWILYSVQNIALQRFILQNGQNGNLTFTLLPIFIEPLIFIFAVYGLMELISGIILFNMKNNKQLVSKAKFR